MWYVTFHDTEFTIWYDPRPRYICSWLESRDLQSSVAYQYRKSISIIELFVSIIISICIIKLSWTSLYLSLSEEWHLMQRLLTTSKSWLLMTYVTMCQEPRKQLVMPGMILVVTLSLRGLLQGPSLKVLGLLWLSRQEVVRLLYSLYKCDGSFYVLVPVRWYRWLGVLRKT